MNYRKDFVRKALVSFFVMFLLIPFSSAQALKVSGKVVDAQGNPVVGAGVVVKGTTNGVVCDLDGTFSLSVPDGAILVVTCISYTTQELPAAAQMNIVLQEDNEFLDEVVVVGYGVQKKSDVTGAISQVGSSEISGRSVTTAQQALQGKTAGVQILSSSAAPGASQTVRVRGYSSNYSSDPLYVVDGLRVSDISFLDPSDIESMEVLKDAASAAIYGAEAGNGVILVTTRRAAEGDAVITYDFQNIIQSLARNPEVLSAKEYINWTLEGGWHDQAYFDTFYDGVTDTDWRKEVFENSLSQRHTLSFQKAVGKTNVYLSGAALSNDGIIKGDNDNYHRYTATVNVESRIKDWLTVGTNTSVAYSSHNSVAEAGFSEIGSINAQGSVIENALFMDPLTPVTVSADRLTTTMKNALSSGKTLLTNEAGDYWGLSDFSQVVNPFIYINAYSYNRKNASLRGSYYAVLSPLEGLTFTSRLGLRMANVYRRNVGYQYYAANTAEGERTTDNLETTGSLSTYYQWENFANYTKDFGKHSLNLMAGVSYSDYTRSSVGGTTNAVTKRLPLFYYLDYSTGDAVKTVSGTESTTRQYSYFGRLNYSYANRYLASVSLRADAADLSVLPKNNRWGYFPSVSLGWIASNESWFTKNDIVSYVKVRGSWGQNGSIANLSNYMWSSPIASDIIYPFSSSLNYNVGSLPSSLGNLNLKWETSEQLDLGLDLRFFQDRLIVTADYYDKMTKDLIVTGVTPSLTAGNDPSPVNAGNVSNRGFEFEMSYKNTIGDLSYMIAGNFATLKNEVTYLDPTVNRLAGLFANGNNYMTSFEQGYPIWYFRGYKYLGVDPDTGEGIFEDKDNNGSYDAADMDYIGSGIPDLTYGITLNVAYKGFDLTVFGSGAAGNDIFLFQNYNSAGRNKLKYIYDNRWTASNTNAKYPRPNSVYDAQLLASSAVIFDGSYFKIKQIQLGYNLPEKVLSAIKLKQARVYVSLDDFFTFTSYPGFDPEVASTGNTNSVGVDVGSYPTSKKVVFGFNVSF